MKIIKHYILINLILFSSTLSAQKISYSKDVLLGKEKVALYGKNYKLQKEAYLALERMKKEARTQNIKIHVVSAYRNFNHQNRLWARKYAKFIDQGYSSKTAINKVKEYTAIPGTSRHHWGTDVDLVDKNKSSLRNHSTSLYATWMNENAHKYGFYRVYTKNEFRSGFNYESWHYSYRKLAKPMLKAYLKLDITTILKNEKILGNSYFTDEFLKKYIKNNVLGINDYLF